MKTMKQMLSSPKRRVEDPLRPTACQWAAVALLVVSASPALADVQHTVSAGETLWSIAEQHTGDAARWQQLQRANRLANPHLLRVGQVVLVPAAAGALSAADASVVFAHGEVWATWPGDPQARAVRAGTSVPEGAVIEVRDKAFVRLKLADGSAFGLSAGAKARLERLRRDSATQQSQTVIRMLSGRVESEVVPRQHPKSRFDVHTPMAVASVRGTRFGVSASPDDATSHVSEGRVAVRSLLNRRQTTTLVAGEGARVGAVGRLQRAKLLPAANLSGLPKDWDDGEFVPFVLPTQPQAQGYRVRVLRADTAGAVLREAYVKDPAVLWQALDDGHYTLAVESLDQLGLLGQTAEHGFRVAATPAAPLYRQPAAGASVLGPSQMLRCTELLDVSAYRIQVADESSFSQPLVDVTAKDRCEHVARLPPGRYHWRVASVSNSAPERQGPFSLPSMFEVVGSTPTPSPSALAGSTSGGTETTHWSPRPGLTYRVQLAQDAAFTRVLSDGWMQDNRVVLPTGAPESVYLRWQSRDAEGRTSRLSPVHRVDLATVGGLRTTDNEAVRSGDGAVGTGNGSPQLPR